MLETWEKALNLLQQRLDPEQFETWLYPLHVRKTGSHNTLTFEVPDDFFAKWVRDNYLELIKDAIWDTAKLHVGIDFHIASLPIDTTATTQTESTTNGLVPRFTFEQFIVGPSNEIAFSAGELVAQSPGRTYNPLFVYGGVGLGKTHILHAIGHRVSQERPKNRILYMSAESYVNEVMTAIKNRRLDSLRHRYRGQCDILLMDDIQYLAGKEFAQEEFFHTFNELYNAGKQLVISSDQFPSAIPKISERLRSRFEWGLIVDIAPPEPQLCCEILRTKAAREGLDLPEDVAQYLATHFCRSVRELEGALNRLTAHALIRRIPLTMDLCRHVSGRIVGERTGHITPDQILRTVAEYFQLSVSDLKSNRRHQGLTIPRHIAAWLIRNHTKSSLPRIGATLGGRTHSTILSGLKHLQGLLEEDQTLQRTLHDLERRLGLRA